MIKVIIWDMDGVIIESEEYHAMAEIEVLNSYGMQLTRDISMEYLGVRLEEYIDLLSERFGVKVPKEEAMGKIHTKIKENYKTKIPMVDSAKDVLSSLSKKYLMALGTSREGSLVEEIFLRFELTSFFRALICAEDVVRGKPDPQVFLQAAIRLGVDPKHAVVIEDAHNGIEAAKRAGMKVIARKGKHNTHIDFSKADATIKDLNEIEKILHSL